MNVIAYAELFTNKKNKRYLTQIAMLRIDQTWNVVDEFFSLVRPVSFEYLAWDHEAYSAFSEEYFITAPIAYEVLAELKRWLKPDDVVWFWNDVNKSMFSSCFLGVMKHKLGNKVNTLQPYFTAMVNDQKPTNKQPRKLAYYRDLPVEMPEHHAANEAKVLLSLIRYAHLTPQILLKKPPRNLRQPNHNPEYTRFYYDATNKYFHRAGCPHIDSSAELIGYSTYQYCLKHRLRPCEACCASEIRKHLAEKNQDTMTRSECNFVYVPGSHVFHVSGCSCVRYAHSVVNMHHSKTCLKMGLVPCKRCKPLDQTPEKPVNRPKSTVKTQWVTPSKPVEKRAIKEDLFSQSGVQEVYWVSEKDTYFHYRGCKRLKNAVVLQGFYRYKDAAKAGFSACPFCNPIDNAHKTLLPEEDVKAYGRFVQAKEERNTKLKYAIDKTQYNDVMTLTQTTYAFWAAKGNKNFHLRSCPKMKGLSGLVGFSTYQEAVEAGYRPCKQCKPTNKHDIKLSIPIYSMPKAAHDENVKEIIRQFENENFICTLHDDGLHVTTPVGKWKADLSKRPLHLLHINRVVNDSADEQYHVQPRVFLSIMDIMKYIRLHDDRLTERVQNGLGVYRKYKPRKGVMIRKILHRK